jgi:hypothetical protein
MYQTLVGIRVLCDWLDNPGRYAWVQFEADDLQEARGLDDIVAKRSDELLELIQVKFTVAPFDPANALSWNWLTERKGARGKSLLEKWSGAAFNVGLENAAELRLITNRRPDADFTAHLRDGRVCLDAMPDSLRKEVEAHVGGCQNAVRFFGRFEFAHSFAGYESLDRTVSAALEGRHTDHLGWLTLCRRAISWSIHKDAPAPDGRITLEVLRSTISERQPRPLDQEFRVPAGYLPPDPEFADEFLRQAGDGVWDLRVLWGSPGQGKSTFLSYVCKCLEERDLPFIRHHYFLDLQDSSERFSLKNVACSLIAQMQANDGEALTHLSDQAEDLRKWIATCGEAYAAQGKRFFVLIDGLDHVWRENDEEIAPLEALFAQLLPLPPNTTLILGTQRVDKGQLPARLNRYLEPEHWVELPRMHLRSVQAWLAAQYEAGFFQIEGDEPTQRQLSQLSSAFERASEGHPLVLTYTFLALTRDRRVLTPSLLEDSTPTPIGDARAYYKTLWQRLSWDAKDALHLMAEDAFIWPAGALERCLRAANSDLESEIGHLLSTVDAGLVAFHGSLYVFISGQPDHARRVQDLLPKVQSWLETEAPPYLRWAWLWLYQSRRGQHEEILAGTTKAWAVEALTRAYPAWQIDRILKAAEEVAFSMGDYEQAIRKRALKTRIHNGLSYQLDDASVVEDCALRLTEDPYPALLLASEVSQSSVAGLHRLAMLYLSLDQKDRAMEVQERMRQKINDRIQSRALRASEYDDILQQYLEVAAGTGRYEPQNVVRLLRTRDSAARMFARFLNRAGCGADLAPCMAFAQVPMPVRLRRVLEIEAVRTAAWSGAKLHEWEESKRFRRHPLSVCWRLVHKGSSEALSLPSLSAHEALSMEYGNYNEGDFAQYIHFVFFAAVSCVLQLGEPQPLSSLGICTNRKWLNKALDRLAGVAHACGIALARGESPEFSLVYQQIGLERPAVNDHESWSDLRAVRQALVLITADIFFLARPRSHLEYVPASEWRRSKESEFFAEEHWRDFFLTRHYRLLHQDDVALDIQNQERAIHSAVQPFNEKGSELSSLCSWATAYGLNDIADRLLASTYRCAIGYGWRKDYQLSRLLQAVEEVSEHSASAAMSAIEKLAPIYTNIDEMTERSGANKSDLADLLLKLMPQSYIRYYRYWLDHCEWYEAEKTFSAFAKQADLQAPVALAAAAFLWDSQTQSAIQSNKNVSPDVLLTPWRNMAPAKSDGQGGDAKHPDQQIDESAMPSIEAYPPRSLPEFLVVVDSAKQYQLETKWITEWFNYWVTQGRGGELLAALDAAHQQNLLEKRATHLFDLAFSLSLNLQGPAKAFQWIIEAHRYRRGWSEHYHGQSESSQRIALVAQHYSKRWTEFVAKSTAPILDRNERGLVIPDAVLVSLLLKVGEIERAVSILQTLVEITQEEFEMQPLERPSWLEGVVV